MQNIKNKTTRVHELENDYPVAGMDEAGCGPWAGPLVAAAVILPPLDSSNKDHSSYLNTINDSKLLTKLQRQMLFHQITADSNITVGIGIVEVAEIDSLLLRGALPLAFKRALENLIIKPKSLLIDGIRDPKLGLPTTLLKGGDRISTSIAAASIIAKVTRDRLMEKLHLEHPHYHWHANKGYGTKKHMEALTTHGICAHHRKSYAPIQKHMNLRQILLNYNKNLNF
jgi:ribonuclease HII